MTTLHMDNKKLAAELAEALVEDRMGKHMVWEDREDGRRASRKRHRMSSMTFTKSFSPT